MKKIILLTAFCLLNSGCGGETEKHQETDTKTVPTTTTAPTTTTPTTTVETPPDSEEVEKSLGDYLVEDYTNLTTKADIIKIFGKENSEDGKTWLAEGERSQRHVLVTNTATEHQVKYLLEDDGETVSSVEFEYRLYDDKGNVIKTQELRSQNGMYTGMSIKDLSQWNENEIFSFSGFGWDFGGGLYKSEDYLNPNSKLAKSDFLITMDYDGKLVDMPRNFSGDVSLSTKDKKVLNSPIIISTISVYLNKDSDEYLQAEDSEAIYYIGMTFDEYFDIFKTIIKDKDKVELTKFSQIGSETALSIEELQDQFDVVFHPELVEKLSTIQPSELPNVTLPNGESGKELIFQFEDGTGDDKIESSTMLYFQKTTNGWKMVSVVIAG